MDFTQDRQSAEALADGGETPEDHCERVLAALSNACNTRPVADIEDELRGMDGIIPLTVSDDPPENAERIVVGVEEYDAVPAAMRTLRRNGFFVADLREGDDVRGTPERKAAIDALRSREPVALEPLREREEFNRVPIAKQDLEGKAELATKFAIPVLVKQDTAMALDEENRRSIEGALEIHFPERLRDEVHEALAQAIGSTPDALANTARESDLPEFGLVRTLSLTRQDVTEPWRNARFLPSDLFSLLEPHADDVLAVSEGDLA